MSSVEQSLQALLPRLLSLVPSPADSLLRLQAHARLYAAVSRLQAVGAARRVYPDCHAHARMAGALVRLLQERLSRTDLPLVDRARLVAALYDLQSEAFPLCPAVSDAPFQEAVPALMDRYVSAEADGVLAEATVCRCLACYFYPDLWDDDEWACLLSDAVCRWASRLQPDGTWPGLSDVTALERIEVMNRYSYLFLDSRFDAAVRRACSRYVSLPAFDAALGGSDELRCLSLCQDLLRQGNACPCSDAWSFRVAGRFAHLSHACPPHSDAAFYASSGYAVHLCETLLCLSATDGSAVPGTSFLPKQEPVVARW